MVGDGCGGVYMLEVEIYHLVFEGGV